MNTQEDEEVRITEWNDITVEGNDVFFSTEVTAESICFLFKVLKQLERDLLAKMMQVDGYKPEIKLYINSGGGDMFAGFSGHDLLRQMKIKVITVALGCCASAATFLLLGGHKRLMGPKAHILIHSMASEGQAWAKYEEMKDEMKNCEKFQDMICQMYDENCSIPEKDMKRLMKKDVYLTPKKCLKWNIVDEIMEPKKINY